jgi:2-amino-4-hydroxy-6-hydroxymethyldihydropteridine diphosphokinase
MGSNRGPARLHLRFALAELARLPRTRLLGRSPLRRTAPVGGPPQPDYWNAAACVRTSLSPAGLLVELKRLEALRGRRPGVRWGPRPLDLDLLFYGDERVRTRLLRVPHPRAHLRAFVRAPLADLAPLARRLKGYPRNGRFDPR